jgi:hypothetical protein
MHEKFSPGGVCIKEEGMIVVQHDEGYSVVELLGDEGLIEIHHQVEGGWD